MMDSIVRVAVGVIKDVEQDLYLLSQRTSGQHLADKWEFPGGKLEFAESVSDALFREIKEELGLEVLTARPLIEIPYQYPGKKVLLSVWLITKWSGVPQSLESQPLRWCTFEDLFQLDLPPANVAILKALALPTKIAILNVSERISDKQIESLCRTESVGLRLRQAGLNAESYRNSVMSRLTGTNTGHKNFPKTIFLDIAANWSLEQLGILMDSFQHVSWGLHLTANELVSSTTKGDHLTWQQYREAFPHLFIGASCHSLHEIECANALQLDYIFLSPVNCTSSHPTASPIGWKDFGSWTQVSSSPVYALGGLSLSDLEQVWSYYGQGIAGISWWKNV